MKLRKSRALALSLLLAAAVLVAGAIVVPFAALFHANAEEIDSLAFRIVRLRRIADSQEFWTREVSQVRARFQGEDQFLEGDTAALASATLQDRIKRHVEQAQGSLLSAQALTPREEDGFTRVGVRFNMTGTVQTLREVLHALESSRPYLLVSSLSVTPDRARLAQAGQLRMDVESYGYLRPKPKPAHDETAPRS